MERLAIIGTGVAGLGCAHFLSHRYQVTLFEQDNRIGGHTHTVALTHRNESVAFDTGFMVYNEVTYPNLTRFFRELSIETQPTSMSFSVQHGPTGTEFCGSSLNHLFGQRRNLVRPRFWRMLRQIDRFNREAVEMLATDSSEESLQDYVTRRGYGDDFLNLYLIPMSGAVWSTPPAKMLAFPALTLLRFFQNHGFLGLHTQHPWRTVTGGSRRYVERLLERISCSMRLDTPILRVERQSRGVTLTTSAGERLNFDRVICAGHADQTLALLASPTPLEQRLLSEFHYQPNTATVHTDESVMPKTRRCWSSWNYRVGSRSGDDHSTIYWMNRLQGVSETTNYFVSINGEKEIHPEKVLRTLRYEHPLFTLGAIRAQNDLPHLNAPNGRVFFCGSYFRYGFHEDAFTSALHAARAVSQAPIWAD